jgi:disulfide oxidoreductase YuzD
MKYSRKLLATIARRYLNEQYLTNNIKVGETYDEADVYAYTQRIHHTKDDFIDGDLGDRIEKYKSYVVKEVSISDIDIDEFYIDDDLVDEYKEKIKNKDTYPPIVLNKDYSIIDGTHRVNALNELGYKKVIAFVGIKN